MKMMVYIQVDFEDFDEIMQFLHENGLYVDAVSSKDVYDQINYKSHLPRC